MISPWAGLEKGLLHYMQNSAHYALRYTTMCKSLHTNVNSAMVLLYILRHYADYTLTGHAYIYTIRFTLYAI